MGGQEPSRPGERSVSQVPPGVPAGGLQSPPALPAGAPKHPGQDWWWFTGSLPKITDLSDRCEHPCTPPRAGWLARVRCIPSPIISAPSLLASAGDARVFARCAPGEDETRSGGGGRCTRGRARCEQPRRVGAPLLPLQRLPRVLQGAMLSA